MKNTDLIFDLLEITENVPLDEYGMASLLKVTFLPPHTKSPKTDQFVSKLKSTFIDIGAQVIPFEDAIVSVSDVRVKPGIVIVEQGDGKDGELAIDHVSGLYNNPIIGINDGPPPISDSASLQETLDSIVGVLAWNLAHVPLFIEDDKWTICTMNGAVIECGDWRHPEHDILYSLVPKLAAQVVPPNRDEIVYRENMLDAEKSGYVGFINDFMESARWWRENGLMLAHTNIDALKYRNRYYRRIVSMYLDHRTGMSYGFLVKQLPVKVKPAVETSRAPSVLKNGNWKNQSTLQMDGALYVKVDFGGNEWIVELPDIWFLSTRSGCNKTDLDPEKDILRLGLQNGKITLETPKKISAIKCRPSYDTFAILAHGVGNIIIASILKATNPNSTFPATLEKNGLSVSHWHGYPNSEYSLPGYVLHGKDNPPVSCSTPQSAAYALSGKLKAIEKQWDKNGEYRGDIHVEPHHGTNITGVMTLAETARWVDEMHGKYLEKS